MAVQFRALFPLALPGALALLGWWWFFSRKKGRVSSQDKQAEASAVDLSTDSEHPTLAEDPGPGAPPPAPRVTQPPEKGLAPASKPRPQPAARRSESSGSLPNTADARAWPAAHRDDRAKPECPLPALQGVPFHHEAIEACKQPVGSRTPGKAWPGQSAALSEKRGPGEKAREPLRAEGTGDAVLGERVLPEAVLAQELDSPVENSRVPCRAPLGGTREEMGKAGQPSGAGPVQKEGGAGGQLSSGNFIDLLKDPEVPPPTVGGDEPRGGDLAGEVSQEKVAGGSEMLEQAASQIIHRAILRATEEVQATMGGQVAGSELQGSRGEGCAVVSQEAGPRPGAREPTPATAEAAAGTVGPTLPSTDPPAEDPSAPKTYVSCLSSPLSSPSRDSKPSRNSAHHVSLVPCSPAAAPLDKASVVVEDPGYASCVSDSSQGTPSMCSSGQCSDSASTSGLRDSCPDTSLSPGDKALVPLPESTVSLSNGVLRGELSDLGAEDGWSLDAETDHSGGSDGNSMDSVDSCCSLQKSEAFQSAPAGSDPKKVDLIVWEIEVPKHLVGRLIGKQGRYVSFLKQTSGAKIYISTLPYTQNVQVCHIEGSKHHVDKALNLIGKKFKELNLTNIYAPPLPSLALPSLPMTTWLLLPSGVTVEVIVVSQVNAGHLFVQQHTHPTFHALRSLDQQMYLCYSQPGIPTLPTPVEIAVICAAPGADGAWWRAQVVASYEETGEVEIRYVDYGGYKRVKVDVLRQIRSDFVTLPFQGAEVLLDGVMPLSDDEHFSPEADAAMSEMTGNAALLAQVTSYSQTGLPLIQLWSVVGDDVVLINRWLVERGLAQWVDSCYPNL
ncbi:A-kinase anchor protein 1, mitochondrial [Echinops telfairi]|uniref:A-kinase anchor protein 1, mitochondrial n=1 Tax=Echinops telfairi TaxID=9371 RepID=A0ABM0IT33_ECHTE|nr:A-kinase anchor protein 1, mitochondrial [Echinops telfairi]